MSYETLYFILFLLTLSMSFLIVITIYVYSKYEIILSHVRNHWIKRGHDRCWENDLELYQNIGLPIDFDWNFPKEQEFEKGCELYINEKIDILKTELLRRCKRYRESIYRKQ